jgi:hypothetical protein
MPASDIYDQLTHDEKCVVDEATDAIEKLAAKRDITLRPIDNIDYEIGTLVARWLIRARKPKAPDESTLQYQQLRRMGMDEGHSMNNAPCSQCGDLDGCHLASRLKWLHGQGYRITKNGSACTVDDPKDDEGYKVTCRTFAQSVREAYAHLNV